MTDSSIKVNALESKVENGSIVQGSVSTGFGSLPSATNGAKGFHSFNFFEGIRATKDPRNGTPLNHRESNLGYYQNYAANQQNNTLNIPDIAVLDGLNSLLIVDCANQNNGTDYQSNMYVGNFGAQYDRVTSSNRRIRIKVNSTWRDIAKDIRTRRTYAIYNRLSHNEVLVFQNGSLIKTYTGVTTVSTTTGSMYANNSRHWLYSAKYYHNVLDHDLPEFGLALS